MTSSGANDARCASHKNQKHNKMKTVIVLFRSIALGLCLLAANAFAGNYLIQVGSPQYFGTYGPFWNNGTIYSVPAGANFEWGIDASGSGYAYITVGGGGLNVSQGVYAGNAYDVGNTSYADNISYQLSASTSGYGDNASALLYVGW